MAYYHLYRPQQFSELVGQDHIRTTLQNALATDRLTHAYLFAGPRGSGKTTTARLLARAVNCLKLDQRPPITDDGSQSPSSTIPGRSSHIEPCNACEVCQDILAGRSLDVIEIDAASNRGIDEVRDIRDKLVYQPARATKKVYIIDEVHMLTKEAFNALLKSLEEPPSHILFIFATTEPDRLPETILSRVQRFDFHRASPADLGKWLMMIAKQELLDIDKDAIALIAQKANGAYRDGAVILEQVVGQPIRPITEKIIEKTLGLADHSSIEKLSQMILNYQVHEALNFTDQLLAQGIEVGELMTQMIGYFRQQLRQPSYQPTIPTILEGLLAAQAKIRYSPVPQLPLELAILEIAREKGGAGPPTASVEEKKSVSSHRSDSQKSELREKTEKNFNLARWPEVIASLKSYNNSLAGILKMATIWPVDHKTLKIVVNFSFHKDRILDKKTLQVIERRASEIFGRPIQIECDIDSSGSVATTASVGKETDLAVAQAAEALFGQA